MVARRVLNRHYICRYCGKMRRAPAAYIAGAPAAPQCCEKLMRLLSYEQTVAATQLSEGDRADWIAAGGKITERGGKRRWRAVW